MHAVSIIHGARSIGESNGCMPSWPYELADYLRSVGYEPVEPFFWSGNLMDGFSKALGTQYANHLNELASRMPDDTQNKLSIIGKSMGPMIAEAAFMQHSDLIRSNGNLQAGTILRIATPDMRTHLCFPKDYTVIDITSKSDSLYKLTAIPLSFLAFLRFRCVNHSRGIKKISLENIKHREFNSDVQLDNLFGGSYSTFSLYESCLRGSALPESPIQKTP